ncbi:hypothetical protein SRO_7345 [Streptomyces rochei]|nr:hypothetical protein SRO_7345 [Streptomyces rochei]
MSSFHIDTGVRRRAGHQLRPGPADMRQALRGGAGKGSGDMRHSVCAVAESDAGPERLWRA